MKIEISREKKFTSYTLDGNKKNNRADNLEWCTRSENMKHAFRLKLKSNAHLVRNKDNGQYIKKQS